MPVPHLEIRIVQRSKGSSAVAGAAYQAGEKLFSEYDQKAKDHPCTFDLRPVRLIYPYQSFAPVRVKRAGAGKEVLPFDT